jgi:MFS transporter, UMF1 family
MRFFSRISAIPKNIWGVAYYDFANSAYFLVYLSFLLPIYFSTVLLTKGYGLGAWGTANAVSTFLGVLLALIAGKYADRTNRLKIFRHLVYLSFIGMLAVSVSIGYFPASLYWLFIIANTFFVASLSVSDSMLPHVSDKTTSYTYGGFAWGFGYLGGIASLLIAVLLQKITGDYSFSVFASVAIFYLFFSVHSIRKLRDTPLNPDLASDKTTSMLSSGREKLLFAGYWLISECITVVFLFFSIFATEELQLSTFAIGVVLLFVQLIGFPATYFGGMLAERYNPLTLLGITVVLWGVIILLLVLFKGFLVLATIVFLAGLVIGNSQSYMRSQYSTLIRKGESGLRFGFYSIVSKASVIIGPVAYGFASDYLNSQKIPIIILYVLMVLGYVLIRKATAPADTHGVDLKI